MISEWFRGKQPLKWVAFITVLVFSFTTVTWAQTTPFLRVTPSSDFSSPPYLELAPVQIRQELGAVEEVFHPQSAAQTPFVYLIQDAHNSLDAQENIRRILKDLVEKEGVSLVLFEGGALKLDRYFYDFAHDHNLNVKVWDALFEKGEISGLERYALESPGKIQFCGIEDESVYFENIHTIQKVYALDEKHQKAIQEIELSFAKQRAKRINGDLKKFLNLSRSFGEKKLPLNVYVKELTKRAKSVANLDFTKPLLQEDWPQLVRITKLMEFEQRLAKQDPQKFPKIDRALAFLWNPAEHWRVRGHLRWYFERAIDQGFIPQSALQNPLLRNWIGYHVLQDELEPKVLFDEIEKLEQLLLERLRLGPEIHEYLKSEKNWALTKKLIEFSLTRKEWQEIKANQPQHSELSELISIAEQNYEIVERRDQILSRRMAEILEEIKAEKIAVVIGGFHADQITPFLKQKFSYALISPTIRNIDRRVNYRDRMTLGAKLVFPNFRNDKVALPIAGSLGSPDAKPFKIRLQNEAEKIFSDEKAHFQATEHAFDASLGEKQANEAHRLFVRLEDEEALNDEIVGSKAKNLAVLGSVPSIKVPTGVVITTMAFDQYLKFNHIGLQGNADNIRQAVQNGIMPEEIKIAIRNAYKELCLKLNQDNPVIAVRSSANAEDLPGASFSGRYESYLNVSGIEDVIDKVKQVWESVFSDAAISYAEMNRVPLDQIKMAVILQPMVDAEFAGVAYSKNPSTGESYIVINAVKGLADKYVDGGELGLEIRIDPVTGKILNFEEIRNSPLLPPIPQMQRLAQSMTELHRFFEPKGWDMVDAEWTIDRKTKELILVQARSATISKVVGQEIAVPTEEICYHFVGAVSPQLGKARGRLYFVDPEKPRKDDPEKGDILLMSELRAQSPENKFLGTLGALLTDLGGMGAHVSNVAREYKLPALVASGNIVEILKQHDGAEVVVDSQDKKVYVIQEHKPLQTIVVEKSGTTKKQRVKKTTEIEGKHYIGRPYSPQSRLQLDLARNAHLLMESIFGFIPEMKLVPQRGLFLLADDYERMGDFLGSINLESMLKLCNQREQVHETFIQRLSNLSLSNFSEFIPTYLHFVMWMNLSGYMIDAMNEWATRIFQEYGISLEEGSKLYEGRAPPSEKAHKQNDLRDLIRRVNDHAQIKRYFETNSSIEDLREFLKRDAPELFKDIENFALRYKFQPNDFQLPSPLDSALEFLRDHVKKANIPKEIQPLIRNDSLLNRLQLSPEKQERLERFLDAHAHLIYLDNSDNDLKARADNKLKKIFSEIREAIGIDEKLFFNQDLDQLRESLSKLDTGSGNSLGSNNHFLVHFDDPKIFDSNVVGSKNRNLALLKQIDGINIPNGFAITIDAFREFLKANRINLDQDGDLIRQAMLQGTVPQHIQTALRTAYHELVKKSGQNFARFAVRSSSKFEDLPGISFSGQYESCLNISVEDELMEAVKRVWLSSYSEKALAYLGENGIDKKQLGMGVSVLLMVDAKIAGVFSNVNPVTSTMTLSVNVVSGLGEKLVSGVVQGDYYEIARDSQEVLNEKINGSAPVISKSQLQDIDQAAKKLEAAFGREEGWKQFEGEFAFDQEGKLWLLQARPLVVSEKLEHGISLPHSGIGYRFSEALTTYPGRARGVLVEPGQKLDLPPHAIMLTENFKTFWTFQNSFKNCAGIISGSGSLLDHSANVTREQKIPAVVAVGREMEILRQHIGKEVVFDSELKTVFVPTSEQDVRVIEIKNKSKVSHQTVPRDKVIQLEGRDWIGRPHSHLSSLQLDFNDRAFSILEEVVGFPILRRKIVDEGLFVSVDDYDRIGEWVKNLSREALLNLSEQRKKDTDTYVRMVENFNINDLDQFIAVYIRLIMWMNLGGYLGEAWSKVIEKELEQRGISADLANQLIQGRYYSELSLKQKEYQRLLAHAEVAVEEFRGLPVEDLEQILWKNYPVLWDEIRWYAKHFKLQFSDLRLSHPVRKVLQTLKDDITFGKRPEKISQADINRSLFDHLTLGISPDEKRRLWDFFDLAAYQSYLDDSEHEFKARGESRLKELLSDISILANRDVYGMDYETFHRWIKENSSNVVVVDGARGEGGGQVLRAVLFLSWFTQRPVVIENFRPYNKEADRVLSGIKAVNLANIELVKKMMVHPFSKGGIGDTRVLFIPSALKKGGEFHLALKDFNEQTTSSIVKLAFSAVPFLSYMEGSSLVVEGVTHKRNDLSPEYLANVVSPVFRKLGLDFQAVVERYGFDKDKNGRLKLNVHPKLSDEQTPPIHLEEKGKIKNIKINIITSTSGNQRIDEVAISNLLRRKLEGLVAENDILITVKKVSEMGLAAHILLVGEYENTVSGFDDLVREPLELERVVETIAEEFRNFHNSDAAVDEHLADMLVLPMFISTGQSSMTVEHISLHLETMIYLINQFAPGSINVTSINADIKRIMVTGMGRSLGLDPLIVTLDEQNTKRYMRGMKEAVQIQALSLGLVDLVEIGLETKSRDQLNVRWGIDQAVSVGESGEEGTHFVQDERGARIGLLTKKTPPEIKHYVGIDFPDEKKPKSPFPGGNPVLGQETILVWKKLDERNNLFELNPFRVLYHKTKDLLFIYDEKDNLLYVYHTRNPQDVQLSLVYFESDWIKDKETHSVELAEDPKTGDILFMIPKGVNMTVHRFRIEENPEPEASANTEIEYRRRLYGAHLAMRAFFEGREDDAVRRQVEGLVSLYVGPLSPYLTHHAASAFYDEIISLLIQVEGIAILKRHGIESTIQISSLSAFRKFAVASMQGRFEGSNPADSVQENHQILIAMFASTKNEEFNEIVRRKLEEAKQIAIGNSLGSHEEHGFRQAMLLDRGGSAKIRVNDSWLLPSSENGVHTTSVLVITEKGKQLGSESSLGKVESSNRIKAFLDRDELKILSEQYGIRLDTVFQVNQYTDDVFSRDLAEYFRTIYAKFLKQLSESGSRLVAPSMQEFLGRLKNDPVSKQIADLVRVQNRSVVITGELEPESVLARISQGQTVVGHFENPEYLKELDRIAQQMIKKGMLTEEKFNLHGYFANLSEIGLSIEEFLKKLFEGDAIEFQNGRRSLKWIKQISGLRQTTPVVLLESDEKLLENIMSEVIDFILPLEIRDLPFDSREGKAFYDLFRLLIAAKLADSPKEAEKQGIVFKPGDIYKPTEFLVKTLLENALLRHQVEMLLASMA